MHLEPMCAGLLTQIQQPQKRVGGFLLYLPAAHKNHAADDKIQSKQATHRSNPISRNLRRLETSVTQIFMMPSSLSPLSIIWIAIAASRMPTKRDITVEIVKFMNLEPRAAR